MDTCRKRTAHALLFLALLLTSCATIPEESVALEVAPRVGCLGPDFELSTPEGEVYKLSDFRGQAVLVNFWATYCPHCKYEMPGIQATFEKYRDQGLMVLGISQADTATDVMDFARPLHLTFPLLLDSKEDVGRTYQVMSLPYSFFVDREGVIRSIQIGEMLKAEMAVQVEAALVGVPAE